MPQEMFLIDSNTLITAFRWYYADDLVPTYWDKLSDAFKGGRIVLLDKVKAEINKRRDWLTTWLNKQTGVTGCSCKDTAIVNQCSAVMNYIRGCNLYSNIAYTRWRNPVADPWLIAAALVKGYTLVTLETPNRNLSSKDRSDNPKIPDVANHFHVKVRDPFYMMRELSINNI